MADPVEPEALEPGSLAVGDVVADRYRIDAVIGEGGMGVVYRARHMHLQKVLALKVLLPSYSSMPDVAARFEREAVAAGRIQDPHVASATDFGRLPGGSFFLVMEYIDGRTLRRALGEGAFDPERALRILRGVASALMAAHTLGIVHRDVKPENIMLVERDGDADFVKVLDFGIAKVDSPGPSDGPPSKVLTKVGAIIGTPGYMSPEQALGQRVDGRSDLYSAGLILFEMLTGHRPFQGGALTQMRQHVLVDVPDLPADVAARVGPRAAAVLKRLVAKSPQDRFADAAELIAAIDGGAREPARPAPAIVASASAGSAGPTMAATPKAVKTDRYVGVAERKATPSRTRAIVAALAAVVAAATVVMLVVGDESGAPSPVPSAAASGLSVTAVSPLPATPPERPPAPVSAPTSPAAPPAVETAAPRASAPTLSIVKSQFADGDTMYWLDVDNPGWPTTVTLVWKHDGKEVARQALHVGKGARWRTWGSTPRRGARVIDVTVLDPQGRVLKTDTATAGP